MCPDTSIQRQRGIGLPAVIFIITTLVLIIAGMAQLQQSSSDGISIQVQSQRAFYAAESGLQLSLNLLLPPNGGAGKNCADTPFYEQVFTVSGLQNCRVLVSCRSQLLNSENVYTLNSRGECGSGNSLSVRQLEAAVR